MKETSESIGGGGPNPNVNKQEKNKKRKEKNKSKDISEIENEEVQNSQPCKNGKPKEEDLGPRINKCICSSPADIWPNNGPSNCPLARYDPAKYFQKQGTSSSSELGMRTVTKNTYCAKFII
ncbi:unnamed protein product [Cuscuta epithymum]|uniref:Uncharacterized protein n=1 Tax=Cuscuta epithymum TaxID=186058 RepID=A0AAV0CW37_9ASTE|nr:unnamed protein product [Cuscuta epithymum]